MPTHVTGAFGVLSPLIDGANQVGSSILTKTWTNTTATVNVGDVFQIEGVFMVNPITKANNGELQNFVVTAAATSSGAGAMTITFDPPINIGPGKDQTVSAAPADGAAIYMWGTATVANVASKTSPQNLGWSDDAITLACVDLKLFPKGTGVDQVRAKDEDLGLSIMFSRGTDIRNFTLVSRFDILYGTALTRPEHMVRVAS